MGTAFEQLLLERKGVVERRELYGLGIKPRDLFRAIQDGTWIVAGRSVLIHRTTPPGIRTDTLVAARRNPDAILTGTSAAILRPHPVWTGYNFREARAMIIASASRRGPWLTVQHPGAGHAVVDGIKVADDLTTLVDLLRFLPWADAAALAGAARQHRLASDDLLRSSVGALKRRAGARQLGVLVRAMIKGAESGPEIDLHHALQRTGVQGWVANPEILLGTQMFRPDIAFLSERIAVEYDGLEEHTKIAAFHHDRDRDMQFQLFGDWKVLRLTSAKLNDITAMEDFIADLRAELRRRRRLGGATRR